MSSTYSKVKQWIFDTTPCPDGNGKVACPSCLAESIAYFIDAGFLTDEEED